MALAIAGINPAIKYIKQLVLEYQQMPTIVKFTRRTSISNSPIKLTG